MFPENQKLNINIITHKGDEHVHADDPYDHECSRTHRGPAGNLLGYNDAEFFLPIGGTIASADNGEGAEPSLNLADKLPVPGDRINLVSSFYRKDYATVVLPDVSSKYSLGKFVDSCNLFPEDWQRIAQICYDVIEDKIADRIVIASGTDTLAYLAAAIARMIPNPPIPIVLTGSMLTFADAGTDARDNLQAARMDAVSLEKGVFISFNGHIIDARRGSKVHSTDPDAFHSIGAKDVAFRRMGSRGLDLNYFPLEGIADFYHWKRDPEAIRKRWEYLQKFDSFSDKFYALHSSNLFSIENSALDFKLIMIENENEFEQFLDFKFNPTMTEIVENGLIPSQEELYNPPPMKLNMLIDNAVIYEHLTPGYNFDWLDELLENDSVHGIIIGELDTLSHSARSDLLARIKANGSQKAIVILENPDFIETPDLQAFYKELEEAGALLSRGMTLEYASISLKCALGSSNSRDEFLEVWNNSEKIGGIGYIDTRKYSSKIPPHELETAVANVRYVHLIPGYEPEWLEQILASQNVSSVVIGGFGSGGLPTQGQYNLLPLIEKYAKEKKIIVRTQCRNGASPADIYKVGRMVTAAGAEYAPEETLLETLRRLNQD